MVDPNTTVVHISSNHIRLNHARRNDDLPVFHVGKITDGVWQGVDAHEIEITGTVRLVYNRTQPLPVGARVWLEAGPDCEVKLK